MKSLKYREKAGKDRRGYDVDDMIKWSIGEREHNQNALYTCMKLSKNVI